jgi:hypothetical protein
VISACFDKATVNEAFKESVGTVFHLRFGYDTLIHHV